ncbi:MAG TPA: hypothetical protein VNQ90_03600 [Chthoniobacteraceae bacterium]|nr:hypothetical protein [Chthoniobacteraceae bacterium]
MTEPVDLQKLIRIAFTAIALVFAAWIGSMIGTGDYIFALLIIVCFGGVLAATILRTSVWYLIPLAIGIGGSIPSIPGGFSLLELASLFTFFSFVVLRAVKSVPTTPTYGLVDVVLFVILFQLVIAFIRNPVGTLLFDSERVGGRPYASIAIAWMGYWVLSHIRITPKLAFRLPFIFAGLNLFGAVNGFIGFLFPAVNVLAPLHSSFAVADRTDPAEMGETRLGFASGLGFNINRALSSYFPPLSNLNPFRVIRCGLFVFGFLAVAISGYRSTIVGMALFFLVAQFYWKRYRDLVVTIILGCLGLGGLLAIQAHVGLPYTIQRSLSFLPGEWDPQAVQDAEDSVTWRVEMWERMFEDSRYLKNRWLGDGFGISKQAVVAHASGPATPEELQEFYLETGAVHSGPVSTIRYVGYIGLALYLLLILLIARKAHRLLRRTFRTPFFPLAVFSGVGPITFPFFFTFVFGFYYTSLAESILSLGILKMLEASFHRYLLEEKGKARQPATLSPEKRDQPQTAALSRP